jgi:hypothetical protein
MDKLLHILPVGILPLKDLKAHPEKRILGQHQNQRAGQTFGSTLFGRVSLLLSVILDKLKQNYSLFLPWQSNI